MQLDPARHAERVTGQRQSALIDLWSTAGLAAAISEVTGPHLYAYGALPITTVAITLYEVRRHVLMENGRVRRDGPVRSGRFRIGQPGRDVLVDAEPAHGGKLVLFYLGEGLLREAAAAQGRERQAGRTVALLDQAWEMEDAFLAMAANRMVEACERAPSPLLAEQLAHTLALHLTDRYAAALPPAGWQPQALEEGMLRRIAERVRADPAAPLTLAEMARIAGLSPSAFIRAFKRRTGMTPHRFVLEERLREACRLLAGTSRPVVDIALSLGFSSQSHFGACFRAARGVSPVRYRRARQG